LLMQNKPGPARRIIRVGVTGGIGSGKSTVCEKFAAHGVKSLSADNIARQLMDSETVLRKEITRHFGERSYNPKTNLLERKYIAGIVFKEKAKLAFLNSLVHPYVFRKLNEHFNDRSFLSHSPYILIEAALMYESDLYKTMDYVLLVVADNKIKVKRVQQRDSASEQEVEERISNQIPDEKLMERADFVLHNNGTIKQIEENVTFFHTLFLTLEPTIVNS
jgi:dephospho-CoA kinase